MFYIIKKAIIFRFPLGQVGIFLHILECEKEKIHFKSTTICRLGLTAADFFGGENVKEKRRPSPNCCIKTVTFILKKSIISKFQDF